MEVVAGIFLSSINILVKGLTNSAENYTFAAQIQKRSTPMNENERMISRECIRQLICTRMASRQAMQRMLKNCEAGITFEMLQIMSCLWNEQGISQQTLAERTAKDKACLTNLMNNLEKKGYVCRHADPDDRRNKLVFLTEEGKRFSQWLAPRLEEYYHRLDQQAGIDTLKQLTCQLKALQDVLESY